MDYQLLLVFPVPDGGGVTNLSLIIRVRVVYQALGNHRGFHPVLVFIEVDERQGTDQAVARIIVFFLQLSVLSQDPGDVRIHVLHFVHHHALLVDVERVVTEQHDMVLLNRRLDMGQRILITPLVETPESHQVREGIHSRIVGGYEFRNDFQDPVHGIPDHPVEPQEGRHGVCVVGRHQGFLDDTVGDSTGAQGYQELVLKDILLLDECVESLCLLLHLRGYVGQEDDFRLLTVVFVKDQRHADTGGTDV